MAGCFMLNWHLTLINYLVAIVEAVIVVAFVDLAVDQVSGNAEASILHKAIDALEEYWYFVVVLYLSIQRH